MLSDNITLSVDTLNDGNPTNRVYTRRDEFQDRTIYKGPSHSFVSRDTLGFYRTYPKPTTTENGVAKSAIKLTQDITVPGRDAGTTYTRPMVADASFNIPVGATAAQTLEFRQRLIAVIDHALAATLVDELEV